jgi:hypothetical protein
MNAVHDFKLMIRLNFTKMIFSSSQRTRKREENYNREACSSQAVPPPSLLFRPTTILIPASSH